MSDLIVKDGTGKYYLKGTIFTSDVLRADRFDDEPAAKRAIETASKHYKPAQVKKWTIEDFYKS